MRSLIICVALLGLVAFTAGCEVKVETGGGKTSTPSPAATSVDEARAGLADLVKLASEGKTEEAKALISKAYGQKLENDNQLVMCIGMLGTVEVSKLKGEQVSPDKVKFSSTVTESADGGTMTMSINITMVKEDGKWKAAE